MRSTFFAALIAPCLLLAGGCSVGNFNSVYRTPNLSDGRSLVLDAEQWVAFNIPTPNDGRLSTPAEHHVLCAMPSPDALTAAAVRGGLRIDNQGGTGGAAEAASMEAAASMALRTQSIQLLRDAMYRMCEAYAAGGLDALEYGIMMRRFQSHMVAILAVEQLTGAVTAQQPRITTTTPTSGLPSNGGNEANEANEPSEAGGDKANSGERHPKADDPPPSPAEPGDAAEPNDRSKTLADREAAAAVAIAQAVESITLASMSTDYTTQMCFDTLRIDAIGETERAVEGTPRRADAAAREREANSRRVSELRQQSAGEALEPLANAARALNGAPPEQPTSIQPPQALRDFHTYCAGLLRRELSNREAVDDLLLQMARNIEGGRRSYGAGDLRTIQALLAQLDPSWSASDLRAFSED